METPKPTWAFLMDWHLASEIGGVNQVVLSLLRECVKDGSYEPLLLEASWKTEQLTETRSFGHRCLRLRIPSPGIGSVTHRSLVSYVARLPAALTTLSRLLKDNNIRVVNAHFPSLTVVTFLLMRLLGMYHGRVIISLHGSDIRAGLAAGWLTRAVWRWAYRNADRVVSVSNGLRDELFMLEPDHRENAVTIYNGVDVTKYDAMTDDGAPLPPPFDSDKPVILSIGAFQHRKGIDLLVDAFSLIAKEVSDASLVLVGGEGPVLEAIRAQIVRLGLSKRVFVFVNVPHARVVSYFKRASVFVLASRWKKGVYGEGWPLVVLEAAGIRCPVVVTRTTGVDEILEDGVHARLVPLEDEVALARAMLDQLTRRTEAREMAERFYALARDRLTWANVWREYLALR